MLEVATKEGDENFLGPYALIRQQLLAEYRSARPKTQQL
jgi:hypothetical protein